MTSEWLSGERDHLVVFMA